jgi:hypothetical protein
MLRGSDDAEFEVPAAVVMKNSVFWDASPRNQLRFNRLQDVMSQKIELFDPDSLYIRMNAYGVGLDRALHRNLS